MIPQTHQIKQGLKWKKFLYTDFVGWTNLTAELLKQKEFKKAMTRSNLCKFWNSVVNKKFADRSKPYSMLPGNVMVIACENAIVAQELLLNKTQLLVKFQPYAKSLDITVNDLKFDAKKMDR